MHPAQHERWNWVAQNCELLNGTKQNRHDWSTGCGRDVTFFKFVRIEVVETRADSMLRESISEYSSNAGTDASDITASSKQRHQSFAMPFIVGHLVSHSLSL